MAFRSLLFATGFAALAACTAIPAEGTDNGGMDNAPTQNSVTPTGTSVVSMFQTNSVAFLVERFLNWQKRRASAVVWAHVNWNPCVT